MTRRPRFSRTLHAILTLSATLAVLGLALRAAWPGARVASGNAGLSADDAELLDLADRALRDAPDAYAASEWSELAAELAESADPTDPAHFEAWMGAVRAQERAGEAPDWSIAATLAAQDPGLVELVDDPDLRDELLEHAGLTWVRVELPPFVEASIGAQRVTQSRGVVFEAAQVPVHAAGADCGHVDLASAHVLQVRLDERDVELVVDGRVRGCMVPVVRSARAPVRATSPVVPEAEAASAFHRSELVVRTRVDPTYPQAAKGLDLEASRCVATVLIGADGVPYNVAVMDCPWVFYVETRDALMQWRWEPPTVEGTPTRASTKIGITYRLAP